MDLSFDNWDYKIQSTTFDCESSLLKFVSDCRQLMDQVTVSHDHDRFTDFLKFYREYKSQSLSLFEFVASYKVDYPTEDRPDSVGRALKLKTILSHAYPHLRDHFYISSSCIDYEDYNRKLTYDMEENFHYLVNFNEHCVVTLKFDLNGRTGFVLYEMSFLSTQPVIVMEDNDHPTHATVSLPIGRSAKYVFTGYSYVEVSFNCDQEVTVSNKTGQSVTGVDVFTLAFFVGASFKRPDISASYSLLTNIQYAYSIREGQLVVNFSHYGDDSFNFQRWDEAECRYVTWEVPLEYFLENVPDPEFEKEFEQIATVIGYDKDELRNGFFEMSIIQHDAEFLTELCQLPLAVKTAKEDYVKAFHNNIRNRFYNIEYSIATRTLKFPERKYRPTTFQYIE